uniref:Crossover junction endonuclease MUS81 n=1 Tax=Eptatretus burgeri TaxID=7764 RepID=A0A8C4QGH8_EPTBU
METVRIGKKRKRGLRCPNNLFVLWLNEWANDAAAKGKKSQYVYQKALTSLKKYPLPLKNGAEAKILQNFGDSICKMLDRKLAEYFSKHGPEANIHYLDTPRGHRAKAVCDATKHKRSPRVKSITCSQPRRSRGEKPTRAGPSGSLPKKDVVDKKMKEYVPQKRSGGYALLITLYRSNQVGGEISLTKAELQNEAQALCDASLTVPEANSRYSAWSSMTTLIKKGLVRRSGKPARYLLTDQGAQLAERILKADQDLGLGEDSSRGLAGCCAAVAPTSTGIDNRLIDVIYIDDGENSGPSSPQSRICATGDVVVLKEDLPVFAHCAGSQQDGTSSGSRRDGASSGSRRDGASSGSRRDHAYAGSRRDRAYAGSRRDGASSGSQRDSASSGSRRDCAYAGSWRDGSSSGSQRDGSSSGSQRDSASSGSRRDGASSGSQRDGTSAGSRRDCASAGSRRDGASAGSQRDGASAGSRRGGAFTGSQTSLISFKSGISLKPGEYDVILCVDFIETTGNNSRKRELVNELKRNGVAFDVRKLSVGDFLWVAKQRVRPVPGQLEVPSSLELVLDYVVERKRMDDLCGSIIDGRFREQKFRLKKCGLGNCIYLVEDHGSVQHMSIPETTLQQAIVNTQVVDGFVIKRTHDIRGSAAYLTIMTRHLQRRFSGKVLWSIPKQQKETLASQGVREDDGHFLLNFNEFNHESAKNKAQTVREVFARQLLQFQGLSGDKAAAILEKFPTPCSLIEAFEQCHSDEERANLLSSIKFGRLQRQVEDFCFFSQCLSKYSRATMHNSIPILFVFHFVCFFFFFFSS